MSQGSRDDGAARLSADSRTAYCRACGRETDHDVALAMLSTATDRPDAEHRKFAQCPGHVLTCEECGTETRSPVNR